MTTPSHPLCYHCQQPALICYTEVDKDKVLRSYICATCSCPSHYYSHTSAVLCQEGRSSLTLECGNCKTVWHAQSDTEQLLGCHQCYINFKNQLITQLKKDKALSSCIVEKNHGTLHVGRSPDGVATMNPLLKLIALNEALQDTLEREDYEQAAVIRDQINHLKMQNPDESSK
ncbi:UvrB/UvrC motif-containing protein [Candidatus Chlamydia sanziniae]|nr:UvrB/UvrC motif-containing protein [Candidatus Chlamydia sanziniae]